MITLYHGSNCDVTNPTPMKGRRGTDFGQGFYLTPDMDSARSMASLVTRRQGDGIRTISVFEFDIDAASIAGLAIRQFESMDADWMSFVLANRCFDRSASDHNIDKLYDVVIGFIADDMIRNMIRLYRSGLMKQDDVLRAMQEATKRLKAGAELVGLTFIDHLIIGSTGSANGRGFVSMAEEFGVA